MLSLNLQEGVLREFLYADDLVLMSETIKGLRNKFIKLNEALESKDLKVILEKTKVIICRGITKMACLKIKLTYVGHAA